MAKFKVLTSSHSEKDSEGRRKLFRAGEICESDRDLVEMFGRSKFELVEGEPEKKTDPSEPIDVTDQFENANGLTITKVGSAYLVYEGDEMLHEDTAKSRINAWLMDYHEEEEED